MQLYWQPIISMKRTRMRTRMSIPATRLIWTYTKPKIAKTPILVENNTKHPIRSKTQKAPMILLLTKTNSITTPLPHHKSPKQTRYQFPNLITRLLH